MAWSCQFLLACTSLATHGLADPEVNKLMGKAFMPATPLARSASLVQPVGKIPAIPLGLEAHAPLSSPSTLMKIQRDIAHLDEERFAMKSGLQQLGSQLSIVANVQSERQNASPSVTGPQLAGVFITAVVVGAFLHAITDKLAKTLRSNRRNSNGVEWQVVGSGAAAVRLPSPVSLPMMGCDHAHVSRSSTRPAMMAKNKKGQKKKKGTERGKSLKELAASVEVKPTESKPLRDVAENVVNMFRSRTGKNLDESLDSSMGGAADIPKALWKFDKAVLIVESKAAPPTENDQADDSHGDEASSEVVVLYANEAALEAHGLTGSEWKQLLQTPSILPAQMDKKYESGYSKKLPGVGTLVKTDRLLLEKPAMVEGKFTTLAIGVAYIFEEWQLDDGTFCKKGGCRRRGFFSLKELQAAVDEQATNVRRLKEEEGKTNTDPEVKAAVAELLYLKGELPKYE